MRMGHRITAAAAALVLAAAPAGAAFACDKEERGDRGDKRQEAEKTTGHGAGKKTEKQHGKKTDQKAENDGAFLKAAHRAGLAEIAMSKDAGKNAVMPCVKKTADTLVKDHTRMDKEIRDMARRLKVTLPGKETSEQRKTLRDLRKKAHKREYDTLWLKMAEAGHIQALELLDDEIANGKNGEVREAARMARPVIAGHLAKVQACQKER
ncbi:DUF4142 domain-containing protein [Streptomyces sp. URMC 127]|uniref:DUF4142 domain-containing protein n=1 Tax=Streptomyces sp. URMC 127 TaxID=3423402 RepID=UPI003F19E401